MSVAYKNFDPAVGKACRTSNALRHQLHALTSGKGEMLFHAERAWASATFKGTRHTLNYVFEGAAAVEGGAALIDVLSEHEFTIPGQLVADAAVTESLRSFNPPRLAVEVELLLLEES